MVVLSGRWGRHRGNVKTSWLGYSPSSVIIHCGCDGHAPPDLPPANQAARKQKESNWMNRHEEQAYHEKVFQ